MLAITWALALLSTASTADMYEGYELAHLVCVRSESNWSKVRAARDTILAAESKDIRSADMLRESLLRPLEDYNIETEFGLVGRIAGKQCKQEKLFGLFGSDCPIRDGHLMTSSSIEVPWRLAYDPWLKTGDGGYWWVRKGAGNPVAGSDDWAVVTDKKELATLTPFPDLCGPFGDEAAGGSLSRRLAATKKEYEEWGVAASAVIDKKESVDRRKLLTHHAATSAEMVASWAIHVLTAMPVDKDTSRTIRELTDDPALSPLAVVAADRYLCRHDGDWAASDGRSKLLIATLRRTRLTQRQVNVLVRHMTVGVDAPVAIQVLTVALRLPEKDYPKRPALVGVVNGAILAYLLPKKGTDHNEVAKAAVFFRLLTSDEYPKHPREISRQLLEDPVFDK